MNLIISNQNSEIVATLDDAILNNGMPLIEAKTLEKLNELSVLTFQTLAESEGSELLKEGYTVSFIDSDGSFKEFIIDKIEDSDSEMSAIRNITATQSAIELKDDLVFFELPDEKDIEIQLNHVLQGTRWEVGYVDPSIYDIRSSVEVEGMTVLDAIFSLQSDFNCDVYFSVLTEGSTILKRQVNFYKQLGSNNGKRFEIGKDVTEVKRTIDTSEIKTAIYPTGKLDVTTSSEDGESSEDVTQIIDISGIEWSISNGDPADKPLGQKWIGNPAALAEYGNSNGDGTRRHKFMKMEFDSDDASAILSMAWVQLGRYVSPKVTYEAKVIDLYRLTQDDDFKHEFVVLGDEVYIIDDAFPNPISISSRIVELERDLLNPENDSVEIGEKRKTYTSQSIEMEQEIKKIAQEAQKANRVARDAIDSANGLNTSYSGTKPPKNPKEGDTWFRPHPSKPEEEQICKFESSQWVVIWDSSEAIKSGKIISEINVSDEGIRIAGDKIHLDGRVKIDDGVIGSAAINELDGNKISAHTLTADKFKVNEVLIPGGDYAGVKIDNSGLSLDSPNMQVRMNEKDGFIVRYGENKEYNLSDKILGIEEKNSLKVEIRAMDFKFRNSNKTTLMASVFKNGEEITGEIDPSLFLWSRIKPNGKKDEIWNNENQGKVIVSVSKEQAESSRFYCDINI